MQATDMRKLSRDAPSGRKSGDGRLLDATQEATVCKLITDKTPDQLKMPYAMTVRKSTVEHVFGTLKHWMGWTHFLTRGIENVATEMSLSVLAYNFKRVLSILGFERTKKAMRLLGA